MLRNVPKGRKVLLALFGCYGLLMLYLLFIRNRSWVSGVPYWTQVEGNCNLIPLRTIGNYWDVLTNREFYIQKWEAAAIYEYHARHAAVNLGGNVAMFIPLGIFLPVVFRKLRGFWKTLLCAAVVLLVVELLQLFMLRGSCDIDDLILNLAGVSLGCGAWKLWQK